MVSAAGAGADGDAEPPHHLVADLEPVALEERSGRAGKTSDSRRLPSKSSTTAPARRPGPRRSTPPSVRRGSGRARRPESGAELGGGCGGHAVHGDDGGAAETYVVLEGGGHAALHMPGARRAAKRSCRVSSAHCARPVAPSGWRLEIRPPDGLTTPPAPWPPWGAKRHLRPTRSVSTMSASTG
jgi:hypothetical protein